MADAQVLGACTERCRGSTPLSCITPILSVVLIFFFSSRAAADALWSGPPTAAPLLRDITLRVLRIDDDKLYFEFHGSERSLGLSKVTRINVDSEPTLNAAEDALAVENYSAAVENYQRIVRSGPSPANPWLIAWASRRMLIAADKSGRFDAAASAYIARVLTENSANVPKPALPARGSTYLDTAVADVTNALSPRSVTDAQRIALLGFLIDLQHARGDAAAAASASDQLDEILARDPANPGAGQAIARRRLATAQAAFDQKNFRQVITIIEESRAQFIDPAQQVDALYLLAEAKFNSLIGANRPSDDPALKNVALDYLRVVARARAVPIGDHVPQSLTRVGQIFEAMNDPASAIKVDDQLVAEYPNDPLAAAAKNRAAELRQAAANPTPALAPK